MTTAFLYTFPQWVVFAALFSIIYGWVENKKEFRITGLIILVAMGLFSIFVLAGNYLAPELYLSPDELMPNKIDEETTNTVPMEKQLLPAYLSFIASSALALGALLLDWFNKKQYRMLTVLTGLVALIGFFIIVGAVRSVS